MNGFHLPISAVIPDGSAMTTADINICTFRILRFLNTFRSIFRSTVNELISFLKLLFHIVRYKDFLRLFCLPTALPVPVKNCCFLPLRPALSVMLFVLKAVYRLQLPC